MQGRRLADGWHYHKAMSDRMAPEVKTPATVPCEPGDYWKQLMCTLQEGGESPVATGERNVGWYWTVCDPNGQLGTFQSHTVEEHEDGTITVTPSILDPHSYTPEDFQRMGVFAIAGPGYHGHLIRGVWSP
jgi:hypothetical protein